MANRRNNPWRIVIFCILSVALFVYVIPICALVSSSIVGGYPTDLESRFRLCSDIDLPHSASVILFEDGERSMNGDGVFTVVFEVNHGDLRALLQSAPFGGSWETGPVPAEIKQSFFENEFKLKAPWHATNTKYVAQDRGPKHLPWHNGRLFIVEPDSRRVWFGEWDY